MTRSQRNNRWLLLAICTLFFAVGGIVVSSVVGMEGDPYFLVGVLSLAFAGVLAWFFFADDRQGEKDVLLLLLGAAVIGGLLLARLAIFPHPARDYNIYLSQWVAELRKTEGLSGLALAVGDYNVPYLYLLLAIAKGTKHDLYWIKMVSVLFDLLLAWFVSRMVAKWAKHPAAPLAAFAVTMAVPTVLLNSAYWSQCDGVYAALLAGTLFMALEGKSRRAWLFLALAFSFKLQTVFFLPTFLLLLVSKKIKWQHIWIFPAAFLGTLLPAVIAGRSLIDTLAIYANQTASYEGYLVLNAPTFYRLFGNENEFALFNMAALLLAGAAAAGLLALLWRRRDRLEDRWIDVAYAFALLLPFLLPKMHDRYFYLSDALSVAYAFRHPKRWWIPVLTVGASYCGYYYYLFGAKELMPPALSAGLMGAGLVAAVYYLLKEEKAVAVN